MASQNTSVAAYTEQDFPEAAALFSTFHYTFVAKELLNRDEVGQILFNYCA
jgi:hypothetical protein